MAARSPLYAAHKVMIVGVGLLGASLLVRGMTGAGGAGAGAALMVAAGAYGVWFWRKGA